MAGKVTPSKSVLPKGLAFEIADLSYVHCWTMLHNWTMQIRLDHGTEGEEYEEVIELRTGTGFRSKSIIWRDTNSVFVQPILGRMRRYRSMAKALNDLLSSQRAVLIDVVGIPQPDD